MISEYLQQYINVVQWDIDQIVRIAQSAQRAYERHYGPLNLTPVTTTQQLPAGRSIATPAASSTTTSSATIPPTTQAPNLTPANTSKSNADLFYERHMPDHARCAVPLAMTLTSVVEFLGALIHTSDIWNNGNKFDTSVKNFFAYANVNPPLSQNHVDLFRAIYRNGLMHGFFPQGSNVAINYDSSFENDSRLFFIDKGDVVLNVNKLRQVVELVFSKIVADTLIHPTIEARLTDYSTFVENKTKTLVDTFKANVPTT